MCASPARADPDASDETEAGGRDFPTTLTLDEPGIDDELILPAVLFRRGAADGGGATHEIDLGAEFEHSITPTTGFFLEDGAVIQDAGEHGAEDFTLGAKWQFLTDTKHETVMSLELVREFGDTGTTHTEADRFGSTTPTLVAGKGSATWASPHCSPSRDGGVRGHHPGRGAPARARLRSRGDAHEQRQQRRLVGWVLGALQPAYPLPDCVWRCGARIDLLASTQPAIACSAPIAGSHLPPRPLGAWRK